MRYFGTSSKTSSLSHYWPEMVSQAYGDACHFFRVVEFKTFRKAFLTSKRTHDTHTHNILNQYPPSGERSFWKHIIPFMVAFLRLKASDAISFLMFEVGSTHLPAYEHLQTGIHQSLGEHAWAESDMPSCAGKYALHVS